VFRRGVVLSPTSKIKRRRCARFEHALHVASLPFVAATSAGLLQYLHVASIAAPPEARPAFHCRREEYDPSIAPTHAGNAREMLAISR
jgi:hypothetical protein